MTRVTPNRQTLAVGRVADHGAEEMELAAGMLERIDAYARGLSGTSRAEADASLG